MKYIKVILLTVLALAIIVFGAFTLFNTNRESSNISPDTQVINDNSIITPDNKNKEDVDIKEKNDPTEDENAENAEHSKPTQDDNMTKQDSTNTNVNQSSNAKLDSTTEKQAPEPEVKPTQTQPGTSSPSQATPSPEPAQTIPPAPTQSSQPAPTSNTTPTPTPAPTPSPEPEQPAQSNTNIATKENVKKLVDYGFTANGDTGAFYNSQVPSSKMNADITVGVKLDEHAVINLYDWNKKVRELTKFALDVFIPTGADAVYSVVDSFADSGQESLDKKYNFDGHKVCVYYAPKTGKVVIEIYN